MARIKPGPRSKRKPGMPPKDLRPKEVVIAADGERFGVFDSRKVYTRHAIARILGAINSANRCPTSVYQLFQLGMPFFKAGRQYLVSGQELNLWVQKNSKTWEEYQAE